MAVAAAYAVGTIRRDCAKVGDILDGQAALSQEGEAMSNAGSFWFLVKIWAVVFYENWLRWPRRAGVLVLDLDKYSVRVEPEENESSQHVRADLVSPAGRKEGRKMMSDSDYRSKLIARGVKTEIVAIVSGHDLDCIGNIVGIYRTSMKEQDPAAYEISEFRSRYQLSAPPFLDVGTLLGWFFCAVTIFVGLAVLADMVRP